MMSKLQKIEFGAILLSIINFIILFVAAVQNMQFFSPNRYSVAEIVSMVLLGISGLVFLVVYIIKIIKEKNNFLRILWTVFPVVAIGFSYIFVNGVSCFDDEYLLLRAVGVILEVLMIVFYNLYFHGYYGKGKNAGFTQLFYNAVVIWSAFSGIGLSYVHHFYLGYLLFAILIGYIEVTIQGVIKKQNGRNTVQNQESM